MEDLSKHFPILASKTYLNTASTGLVPKPIIDWRSGHDQDLMNRKGVFSGPPRAMTEQIRKTVAGFFNASTQETALVPNFSLGINMVLDGLPEGQKIVLLKNDYPSVNWPVETRDFDVCYAEIDENLERNIEIAFDKCKPDVFMFSIVQWINGIKIDFDFLSKLKSYHPNVLLIADGTQYLGTEAFNFSESAIDVLSSSSYKWLTAGFGNGFLMIKEVARNRIFPKSIGFNSAEAFESDATETAYMKHFEPGHLDTLNFGSLQQSLLFVESLGREKLYENIKSLSMKAKERFAEMGLLKNDILLRENHSSIFNLKGDQAMFEKLVENNISCIQRGDGIRVGFHYYNSEDDLEKLLAVLRE